MKPIPLDSLDDPDGVAADHDIVITKKYVGEDRDDQAMIDCQRMADEGNVICRKAIKFLQRRQYASSLCLSNNCSSFSLSIYMKFERVENKKYKRPDLHAFLLLNRLCPNDNNIVDAAGHDKIWLNVDLDDLAKVITEDQIIELIRCGVCLSNDPQSLTMIF